MRKQERDGNNDNSQLRVAIIFVECGTDTILYVLRKWGELFATFSKVQPSSQLESLSILQPFHLNIRIGHLDGKLDFMPLCHLIGRIQLLEESYFGQREDI